MLHLPHGFSFFREGEDDPASANAPDAVGSFRADAGELHFIGVVSVAFQSDHQMMTDQDDGFDAGGKPLPTDWTWKLDPDSQRIDSHPVSHTAGQKVRLAVTVRNTAGRILSANLTGQVSKPASAAAMRFVKNGHSFRPGDTELVLESNVPLGANVERAIFSVDWEVSGLSISASQLTYGLGMVYGPTLRSFNHLFITLGKPQYKGDNAITIARMKHAVKALAKAIDKAGVPISADIYKVVNELVHGVGFQLDGPPGDDWFFARDPDAKADCITIARYVEAVLRMVGVPGTAEAVIVYPRPKNHIRWRSDDPPDPDGRIFHGYPIPSGVWAVKLLDDLRAEDIEIVAEQCPPPPAKAGLAAPRIKRKGHDWHLMLVDRGGKLNNFEGTVKFTPHGKEPRWYPCGTRFTPGQEKMESVITKVFRSLSWVDEWDEIQSPAVISYRK